jgi:hypothetical protein
MTGEVQEICSGYISRELLEWKEFL